MRDDTVSVLSEAKIKHLSRSAVYKKYFEASNNKDGNLNFYIIEENSMFSTEGASSSSLQQHKIINTQRRIRQIRRLSDFEVFLLISKSFGHLISKAP